jgi:hypothetical protein
MDEARESSGSVGARAVGRLQKSVRGIFPALLAASADHLGFAEAGVRKGDVDRVG